MACLVLGRHILKLKLYCMNVVPDYAKLAELREGFEGFSNKAYKKKGDVWTIGTGFTYNYDKQRKVKEGDIINRITNAKWTEIALKEYVTQANQYIKAPLTSYESTAIVDYIFNRGISTFLKTQLDELINANPKDPQILKEIIGTGLRNRLGELLWGLGRRRRAEAYLYKYGIVKVDWPKWGNVSF